jgi:hypothetical protein
MQAIFPCFSGPDTANASCREENEELRINFETLKQAFQTIQGKYRDSQAAHTATQQELARVVRERDSKFMAWRSELELKVRQFEELKQQVITQSSPRETLHPRPQMVRADLDFPRLKPYPPCKR